MSNSLQPHELQPSRLLCPWEFSRQAYWSGLPCPPPGDLLNPGIESRSSTLQVNSWPSEPPGKPRNVLYVLIFSVPLLLSSLFLGKSGFGSLLFIYLDRKLTYFFLKESDSMYFWPCGARGLFYNCSWPLNNTCLNCSRPLYRHFSFFSIVNNTVLHNPQFDCCGTVDMEGLWWRGPAICIMQIFDGTM